MALEFGLGRYDRTDPKNSEAWTARWNKLDKSDQQFAYNHLAFILMFTDIGVITEKSIPHIVQRLAIHSPKVFWRIFKGLKGSDVHEFLKKFIGFSANVRTTSSTEFLKRVTEMMKRKLPKLTEKDIEDTIKMPDVFSLN